LKPILYLEVGGIFERVYIARSCYRWSTRGVDVRMSHFVCLLSHAYRAVVFVRCMTVNSHF